ncbi:UDP-galactopyranose mutase [Citrobacter freundii]|uniref:UDP-galactopyranose mutase n=1 Tax=Citrobacter TaxID=544 RepID=UPI000778D20E|nr:MULTISPECIES: UDP-galactopyranose mutase [Citrobacter]EJR7284786.1 UDP-galactopyranose mutase [Citrobacter freundii]EKT9245858.1 UDP-galactopyranose mutase [Citrobacter freundii]EKW8511840.1 UDP-galactopyranose mutase [Citrobacter freundii]EMB4319282.1 UDP-galactopyranose mutase [Citrobacter freundii]KYC27830.1 UDP-galactopyranose mutase [Citrobacter sp. AATXQ]
MKVDYLIVGSGLFGAIFAYEMNKRGFNVKIIEKRSHVGGNIYCEKIEDINVHKYGAHIFHTNDKNIWEYVNKLTEFNRFTNSPIAISKGEVYNLPFNMNTFNKIWGVSRPQEAMSIIASQRAELCNEVPSNLEEQAISLVGRDVYELLIKEYTEKQWGRSCKDLPAFIIKRLPVRFTYDNNYFTDKYQGIPIGGYNEIIDKLLDGINCETNVDFFDDKDMWLTNANKIVYTGPIDKFFDYKHGALEYRSLRFENEIYNIDNFQGNAVVNYIDSKYEFTRIIEHKHFEFGMQPKTVITKEFPKEFVSGDEPYYPVNDSKNNRIYSKYKSETEQCPCVIFGGRLAEYKYYDMHQVISSALKAVDLELGI